MSLYVDRKIQSELGEIKVAVTSIDHISARAEMEVRGIKYNVHNHYHFIDGEWKFRSERESVSVTGSYNNASSAHWGKSPAPTVLQKIVDAMTTAVRTYAKANPLDFTEAEDKRLTGEIASLEALIAEKEAELSALRVELTANQSARETLRKPLLHPEQTQEAKWNAVLAANPVLQEPGFQGRVARWNALDDIAHKAGMSREEAAKFIAHGMQQAAPVDAPRQIMLVDDRQYTEDELNRDAVIKAIRYELNGRSRKSWSVKGGRGTSWGWITISAPPTRLVDEVMTEEDRKELAKLLNLAVDQVSRQGVSVAASRDHYIEYMARARGKAPAKIAQPYWD